MSDDLSPAQQCYDDTLDRWGEYWGDVLAEYYGLVNSEQQQRSSNDQSRSTKPSDRSHAG